MGQKKKPSPRLEASFLSSLIFWWLKPLIYRGTARDLTSDDLHDALPTDLSEQLGTRLEKHWKNEVENARQSDRKPKLVNAIGKTFGWSYFYYAGHMLVLNCLRVLQPFVLAYLIGYFEHDSGTTRAQAYFYACTLVLMTLVHGMLKHHIDLGTLEIGMRLRIACSSLVYRKVVRLSSSSVSSSSAGQVINLLSNDVARFDQLFMYLHYVWMTPLVGCFIAYLIWRSVGPAALAGVLLMTLETIPVQVYVGKITSRLRAKIATRTDERVRLMGEIIRGIHVIKMYTWEKPFERLVSFARRHEIDVITSMSYLRGINTASNAFIDRTCLYFTVMAYALVGNAITAKIVFSLVQYFTVLQIMLAWNYPRAIFNAAEARVSVRRIEKFLLMEEVKIKAPLLSVEDNGSISLKSATASWSSNSIVNTLHDVTLHVAPKKLHAIVGPVGAGKTSLIQLMLGELRSSRGELKINGTISYASQRPWLFPGTIRDNIVFDQLYDEARYEEILRVCSLVTDLERLPNGDRTYVGDRGTNLSGGQCARINLARAVYRDADIYVLDDPLAAVDPVVGRCLFEVCVSGYLSEKTRILVTHQAHCLREADVIFLLNNGKLESQGRLEDFSEKELSSLNIFGDEEATGDEEVEEATESKVKGNNIARKDEDADGEAEETAELIAKGKMRTSIFSRYFESGNSRFLIAITVLFFVVAQTVRSGSDYWLAYWTRQEELRYDATKSSMPVDPTGVSFPNATETSVSPNATTVTSILNSTQALVSTTMQSILPNVTGSWSTTTTRSLSNVTKTLMPTVATSLGSNVTSTVATLLPNTTERLVSLNGSLSAGPESLDYLDVNAALIIYGLVLVGCIVTAIVKVLLLYKLCMNSSRAIHDEMFSCVLKAPMRFFDKQTSGQILNRFSKDSGAMDEVLPVTIHESVEVFSVILGVIAQIIIVNWWSVLAVVFTGYLYWKLKNVYVPTAYGIKRLEGAAKSPVLSHVTATLEGLATIRSSRGQTTACRRFDARQDAHTRSYFLNIAVASAFGLWLDLCTVILVAFVTLGCVFGSDRSGIHAGSVGLAITQIMMMCGMLQRGIRQAAEMMTQMTSVERILQFTQLEQEESISSGAAPTSKPPASWPSRGRIEFRDFSLHYNDNKDDLALRDVNLVIEAGSKVGIVGRTGSGKSSLITALFRLARSEGQVLIDELDTRGVRLAELRKRIAVIPQEPVLFSTSLRDNLDPFHEFEDTSLWAALEDVRLHKAFVPLDHPIECGGRNLSAGQRQLLCLARALVKRARILVLDEATANVDPATDALLRETIRTKFAECTVLTVAHRLDSVIDSDLVVVVDDGRVVEYGQPRSLLAQEDGLFLRMAGQDGDAALEHLRKTAEETYLRLNSEKLTAADEQRTNGVVKSNAADKTAIGSVKEP
ncbi:multidrug resistance-associated protein 4-like [Copidosoma floridanum]|uniref:multidrug resistance-associated protein 4-like n=1 Tax=Copidosoma floridanum TaxID=29053 RepID=UPI0006C946F2|nr:multidrug resistance-associated protein 4-like [Copidosoma floridanum]